MSRQLLFFSENDDITGGTRIPVISLDFTIPADPHYRQHTVTEYRELDYLTHFETAVQKPEPLLSQLPVLSFHLVGHALYQDGYNAYSSYRSITVGRWIEDRGKHICTLAALSYLNDALEYQIDPPERIQ